MTTSTTPHHLASPNRHASPLLRELAMPVTGLALVFVLTSALSLWVDYWWASALIMFAFIVIAAERIGRRVPLRHKRTYEIALAVAFPVLLLVGWELIVNAEVLNPRWFPPPSRIGTALVDITVNYDQFNRSSLLGRPWLMPDAFREQGWAGVVELANESHVWATLMRVFLGFLIGAIPGIFIGFIMGINKTVRSMLDTTMSAIYVLPKIAIFPIMMLIFDNPFGEGPKISVVAISAFFLVAISTMTGVRDVDPVYIQAGKNYGANRWQMFRHVIIPAAMPVIFSGLRLALGTALIVIVAIEFLRAKHGVGWVVYYNWQVGVVDKMYAGLFVVMLMGILLTYGLQWVENRLMPWRR